tara:strand:+ start:230 stop:529 length:300 start_codon:yes stop_codon:yes gene_type:complete
MQEQVPPSQSPVNPPITPEQLEQMKARARELAIQQTLAQNAPTLPPKDQLPPKVVYVRRNLTIAEFVLVLIISCCLVTGVQFTWNVVNEFLPRLEIRVK